MTYLLDSIIATRAQAATPTLSRSAEHRLREVCHDLRHPAATIRALVAAIELEADLGDAPRARLRQIVAEARRIDDLTSEVLSPSNEPDLLRLDRVVAEIVAEFDPPPFVELVAVPVVARIPDLAARRVLWNLIGNAQRATGPSGSVLVAVWSSDERVIIEVSDDGPGFGAAASGDAGLGLTIVRGLVSAAGGELEIGTGELGGASVRVLLPIPCIDLTALEQAEIPRLMHSDE